MVKQFLDRASEEGGEAWLRRCLESATGSEEDGEAEGAASYRRRSGQWVDEPPVTELLRQSMTSRRFRTAAV